MTAEAPVETIESFVLRVAAWCGDVVTDIRIGTLDDVPGGQIIARRGDLVLVTHGYPEESDDGTPIYYGARIVGLCDPYLGFGRGDLGRWLVSQFRSEAERLEISGIPGMSRFATLAR